MVGERGPLPVQLWAMRDLGEVARVPGSSRKAWFNPTSSSGTPSSP